MYIDNLMAVSGTLTRNSGAADTFAGQPLLTLSSASLLSTNTIDLGSNRDVGEGSDIFMRVVNTSAYTAATTGVTLEIQAIISSVADLSANVAVIGSTGAINVPYSVSSGSYVIGQVYTIATLPTVGAFTSIGAAANTVGTTFVATATGSTLTGGTALTNNATVTAAPLNLTTGSRLAANLNPTLGSKAQRYLGARFVAVGTLITGGASYIDFGLDIQDGQKYYPNGFAVL
jgi:hypothetical protein